MKRRPKGSNPKARQQRSRHDKSRCEYCGQVYSEPSLTAHFQTCPVLNDYRQEYAYEHPSYRSVGR